MTEEQDFKNKCEDIFNMYDEILNFLSEIENHVIFKEKQNKSYRYFRESMESILDAQTLLELWWMKIKGESNDLGTLENPLTVQKYEVGTTYLSKEEDKKMTNELPEIPEIAVNYYKVCLEKIFAMLEEVKKDIHSENILEKGAAMVTIQTIMTAFLDKLDKKEKMKGESNE